MRSDRQSWSVYCLTYMYIVHFLQMALTCLGWTPETCFQPTTGTSWGPSLTKPAIQTAMGLINPNPCGKESGSAWVRQTVQLELHALKNILHVFEGICTVLHHLLCCGVFRCYVDVYRQVLNRFVT